MGNDIVVKLDNVSKYYKLYNSPKDRLKEALNPFRKKYHRDFYALNNISFELRKGECLGIIGKNGMGKSTLLKLIAHIIEPSSGTIQVNGTVSALLELGTGFNPEFTGLENIYFYGTILGFKKNEIEGKVKEIVDFADIGEFINQPVKTYSSGMFVRLAFAVQTSLKPDILLVDEVLSVGDIFFQQKCHARIEELMSAGSSLILVSHDMSLIEKYSKQVLLLDHGKCLFQGDPHKAVHLYFNTGEEKLKCENLSRIVGLSDQVSKKVVSSYEGLFWPNDNIFTDCKNAEIIGDNEIARLTRVALTSEENTQQSIFQIGELLNVYYEYEILADIGFPVGGVELRNSLNLYIHGKNTLQYDTPSQLNITQIKAGAIVRFRQSFNLSISAGEYIFSLGLATLDISESEEYLFNGNSAILNKIKMILRVSQAGHFSVIPRKITTVDFYGYVNLAGDYKIEILH